MNALAQAICSERQSTGQGVRLQPDWRGPAMLAKIR